MSNTPYSLSTPPTWNVPLVVSAPHAGVEIPRGFQLPQGRSAQVIQDMSDTGVDQLTMKAAYLIGFPVLSSRYLRAFIDLNRGPDELDPLLIDDLSGFQTRIEAGSRVAAGLGLIPRLADPHTSIYPGRLSLRAVQSRIERYYDPYHAQLANLIKECLDQFGQCFLIDLHSMPPIGPALAKRCLSLTSNQPTRRQQRFPQSPINLVIGTDFGNTISTDLEAQILAFWQSEGLTVSSNRPYPGGYITTTYGKIVPTIQIEVCRTLYPGRDVSAKSKEMEALFGKFITYIMGQFHKNQRQAAE